MTYPIRPATIADLLLRNGSSRQAAHTWNRFRNRHRYSRLESAVSKKIHQGKVRDIYDVDADHLLIVTTDRLSAFDVVLPDPIPFKGEVLTQISAFWFEKTRHMVANHLTQLRLEDVDRRPRGARATGGRSMVVKKLTALPIEAVVRGYSDRLGLQGLQAARFGVRHRIAAGIANGGSAAGAHVHSGFEGARRPTR